MQTSLTFLADNLAYLHHPLVVNGVSTTTRMTVLRLGDGALWVHSPVPVDATIRAQLDHLGPVRHIVAPSLAHHLFVKDFRAHYPDAMVYGAPGLKHKRPDIEDLHELGAAPGPWAPELEYVLFGGMPMVNETVWFHAPSATLILTDVCQCWQGPLAWQARLWSWLTQTRERFDVPVHVRWLVRDKVAARASAQAILRWPFQRVVMAHNAVIEQDAHAQVLRAFRHFLAA